MREVKEPLASSHSEGVNGAPAVEIITSSRSMQEVLRQAKKVAPLTSSVLIYGESGTGKELLARAIHQDSKRNGNPFVALNCGSISHDLLESELFGHEAGAFTGAMEQHRGLFEEASGGTLFLDEIGNMQQMLQVKLLRTLQESEIRRVGGSKNIKVDVRIIAATNCDLDEAMRAGSFRPDLYYRLGVVILTLPPLRDRCEDVPQLVHYFVSKFSAQFQKERPKVTAEAMELLRSYRWPGNVRELENVIQRVMIFSNGEITAEELRLRLDFEGEYHLTRSLHEISSEASKKAEIQAILATLSRTNGNKLKAASLLGVSYKTLLTKVKDYGLEREDPALS